MAKRIISAFVGLTYLILMLVFNNKLPFLLNITAAIISVMCIYELSCAFKTNENLEFFLPTLIFVGALPIIEYTKSWGTLSFIYAIIILFVIVFDYKILETKTLVANCSLAILISISISCLVTLRNIGSGYYGIFYLLLPLALSWTSDTGAFFVGKYLGKHKLCEQISPKKTVEGAIGGVIFGVLGVLILCFISREFFFSSNVNIHYVTIVIMSALAAPIGILGDLAFSVIKRECNIKDFGNIMPGHGGMLDRFDSVILVTPFMYIFMKYFAILF